MLGHRKDPRCFSPNPSREDDEVATCKELCILWTFLGVCVLGAGGCTLSTPWLVKRVSATSQKLSNGTWAVLGGILGRLIFGKGFPIVLRKGWLYVS